MKRQCEETMEMVTKACKNLIQRRNNGKVTWNVDNHSK